jgi:E3 ubiquitin-protein ligase EDD1
LIYIDPTTLRRTTVASTTATAAAAAAAAAATNQEQAVTVATTTSQLARTFGIVIRQIADLLTMLQDYSALAPNLPKVLEISYQEVMDLQVFIKTS